MPHPDSDPQQNLTRRIAKWKAGLADLGRRNPLIKFRQDSPRSLEILTPQAEVIFQHLTKERRVYILNQILTFDLLKAVLRYRLFSPHDRIIQRQ
jgi:Protein of unknown function (DUF4011)